MTAHLHTGATTLCWCWRLTRRDGIVQGFTDHDRPLSFDGTKFEAAAGFTASEMTRLSSASASTISRCRAPFHRNASPKPISRPASTTTRKVEIFRVNWAATEQRVLMRSGILGEVRRAGTAFTAEVRGLTHYLQQPKGRLYQYACDADLGDARCSVDLDAAGLSEARA